jgi:hypothetical protein
MGRGNPVNMSTNNIISLETFWHLLLWAATVKQRIVTGEPYGTDLFNKSILAAFAKF